MVELNLPKDLKRGAELPLRYVIDVRELVNYRTLLAKGLDAEDVTVEYDPTLPGGAFALENGVVVILSRPMVELFQRYPEYAYVVFAHELVHMTQENPEEDPMTGMNIRGRPTKLHSRLVREQEAIFWEAQQAAKFGWSREDYKDFTTRLVYHQPYSERILRKYGPHFFKAEIRERPYAALPALSRRPVRVRGHKRTMRRRIVSHLENPPDYCLCNKSVTVDRVRRGMIRRMK